MLSDVEKKVLEIINGRLLITENELNSLLSSQQVNGARTAVQRLKDTGYIDKVQSLGTCIVITQKGMRALKGK